MLQLLPGRLSMNAGMLSVMNSGVVCSSLSSVPQRCQYFFKSVLPDIRHFHKGPDSSEDWIVWQAHACLSSIKCERLRSIVLASIGCYLISQKKGHACAAHDFIALVPGHMGPDEASKEGCCLQLPVWSAPENVRRHGCRGCSAQWTSACGMSHVKTGLASKYCAADVRLDACL